MGGNGFNLELKGESKTMNDQEKIDALAEVFETTDIAADTPLEALSWDSMAMLSVMAIVKSNGKSVTGQQLRDAKTVSDLLAVM